MKVDFNNLRVLTIYKYDEIVEFLNNNRDKDDKNKIVVDAREILKEFNELRGFLWSIACCYKEDDPECKDVSEELEPIAFLRTYQENLEQNFE